MKKFLSFIAIIASVLCGNNANAAQLTCPAGCFCLNNGKIDGERIKVLYGWQGDHYDVTEALVRVSTICQGPAQTFAATAQFSCNITGWYEIYGSTSTYLICDREKYSHYGPNNNDQFSYYMDEFSEMYNGTFGIYGRKNNEVIYFPNSVYYSKMYQCPVSYPISDQGAKTITDCYTYDLNGNKLYYGTKQTILCNEGKYLKANATTCSNCRASKQQICPGGKFEQSDVIQGLKLQCYPGQYLPANATQCESCDNNNYLCPGGIYNAGINQDQGNIMHNGFIAKFSGITTSCQPGYYIKANTNTCTACTGDYVCPGGIFYTDATYTQDRGRILCAYGTANSNHTACVAQSTLPSFMKNKILKNDANDTPVASNTNIQPSTGTTNSSTSPTNTTGTTTTIQPTTTSITAQNISLPLTTAEKKFDFGNLVSPFADRSATQQKRHPTQTTGRTTRVTPQIKKQQIQPQSAQHMPAHRSNNNKDRPSPRQ